MGVDAGAAVGEFMQIQLSQDDRALLAQPRQDRCVASRDVIFQDDGAGRGLESSRSMRSSWARMTSTGDTSFARIFAASSAMVQ